MAHAEVASTYVLVAWDIFHPFLRPKDHSSFPLSKGVFRPSVWRDLSAKSFVLPINGGVLRPSSRRMDHPFGRRKGLPIGEGILRPSPLRDFSSLPSAEGSFILFLIRGIYLPSLWRDRSSIPSAEGSFFHSFGGIIHPSFRRKYLHIGRGNADLQRSLRGIDRSVNTLVILQLSFRGIDRFVNPSAYLIHNANLDGLLRCVSRLCVCSAFLEVEDGSIGLPTICTLVDSFSPSKGIGQSERDSPGLCLI
ncbi:uncharacterized protein G2W53_039578 [Senna tora]|uniref:Uncharacterized protein n=1 Tax=Senna tora TaxID=362788 RepID=A0A834SPR3_9FABA|nr:uncharacterized protein G2W53_039578 [Senna tora]